MGRKEAELQSVKEAQQAAQKQQYQQDQIQDRLRHYEAQAQLVDTLQNELTAAQVREGCVGQGQSEDNDLIISSRHCPSTAGCSPPSMSSIFVCLLPS